MAESDLPGSSTDIYLILANKTTFKFILWGFFTKQITNANN